MPGPRTLASCLVLAVAGSCAADHPAPSTGPPPPPPPEPHARPLCGGPLGEAPAGAFSFLCGGHLYGEPMVLKSMPSPTLVAAVDDLAASGAAFLVSAGDLFRAMSDLSVEPTLYVLSHLRMPVFNAPGNHDWKPDPYEARFGESYGSFRYGSGLFVLLNTELDPWHIRSAQLEFLRRTIEFASSEPSVRQVFLFAHKVLFAVDDPRYRVLFEHMNAQDGFTGECNFQSDVRPLLVTLAREKPVFWFAGDIGASWTLSLFFDRDPDSQITYVATGLGATRRDCLVRVTVRPSGAVDLAPVPLPRGATSDVGEPVMGPIEAHGLEHWQKSF